MFGRIPWHVMPEPPATLQGAATARFNGMSSQSHVSHCRVLPLGEFTIMIPATLQGAATARFNGMSSQSHVSHCRVLPLGEFTIMIPATLQGAVTWRNQCHHRATLHPPYNYRFSPYFIFVLFFKMQFGL